MAKPHFRAGVVTVVRRADGQVLAFERSDRPGQWQLPQGGIESGETPSAAAWRELAEDDALEAVANPVFGPRVQREFRNMTRKLRRNVRRSVERGAMAEWIGIEALMESLEVVSIAYESARDTTGDHVRSAVQDSLEMFRESPLSAPMRCAANNARVTFRILGDVIEISRETLGDLDRVNQERKDRVRLMDREPSRR